jgi:hypothetical protein
MADIVQPCSTGTPSNSFTSSAKLRSTIVMTPPTPSTSGEQRTPNRRVDVRAAEVVDGEYEEQQGDFLEVVG